MIRIADLIEPFKKLYTFVVVSTAISVGYLALIHIGPKIETLYFPVFRDYSITQSEKQGNRFGDDYTIRMVFNKVRTCEYRDLAWYAGDPTTGYESVDIKFVAGPPQPIGMHLSSRWTITVPPDAPYMFGLIRHECGLPWTSETILGPFKLPIPDTVIHFKP